VQGGLNFGNYDASKHMAKINGRERMAGDVFQKTFGDEGWNQDLLESQSGSKKVSRDASLDMVGAQVAEKEYEKEMAEWNAANGF